MSYGQGRNPYDQRDNSSGGYGNGYNSNPYAQQQQQGGYGQNDNYGQNNSYNTYDQAQNMESGYGNNSVEMSNLPTRDPNYILNECRSIDEGIEGVENNLRLLRQLHQRVLEDVNSASTSESNRQLDAVSAETMADYRALTQRVREVKSNPDARSPKNSPQVGRVDRRLKRAIQDYQKIESDSGNASRAQLERQYRIVRPDATDAEIREAVEDPNGQMFQQALMHSDRQGRARAALSAVQDRHAQIQKIEQQIVELSQLFQDMDTLIVQQDVAVTQIDQKAEEVVDNLDKGNTEVTRAVETARSTRKKKWWCLGITVLIIIIAVVIGLVVHFVVNGGGGGGNNNNNNKRDMHAFQSGAFPVKAPIELVHHHAARLAARAAGVSDAALQSLVREARQ